MDINEINNQFLDKLRHSIYKDKEKEIVFGSGNIGATILMIGEAPGANEVKEGKPFVGAAGKNLTIFLETLQLKREELYITNAVKFRPTAVSKKTGNTINRKPDKDEVLFWRELLILEIEIVKPKIIVTLGNVPLSAVLDENIVIGKVHGTLMDAEGTALFPLYHPASIIYNQKLKVTYNEDLVKLKEVIQNGKG